MTPDVRVLVLASASRSRTELLTAAGVAHSVQPAMVDEAAIRTARRAAGDDVAAVAMALAEAKAAVVSLAEAEIPVIGADQMLDCGGTWLDKPADRAEAERHLRLLRGREHRLITAVCLTRNGRVEWRHVETVRLTMRRFSDRFLDDYLDRVGNDVTGTVGAYRLEGPGATLFERIDGDYFSILGLPLLPLLAALRDRGLLMD